MARSFIQKYPFEKVAIKGCTLSGLGILWHSNDAHLVLRGLMCGKKTFPRPIKPPAAGCTFETRQDGSMDVCCEANSYLTICLSQQTMVTPGDVSIGNLCQTVTQYQVNQFSENITLELPLLSYSHFVHR